MTDPTMTTTPSSDDKLADLLAQLAGHTIKRGLDHAYRDDPHLLSRVAEWRQTAGARLELRMVEIGDTFETHGVLVDTDGELLVTLFTVIANRPGSH